MKTLRKEFNWLKRKRVKDAVYWRRYKKFVAKCDLIAYNLANDRYKVLAFICHFENQMM